MEVIDYINSYNRKEKNKQKSSVWKLFVHAEVTRRYLFPEEGHTEPPHPWDYFPELFDDDKDYFEEKRAIEEFEQMKERRRAYFAQANQARRLQGEADVTET